jgi:hypothetical protein
MNLPNSRESLLFGEEKYNYDLNVLNFFRMKLPLIQVDQENQLENKPQ